jgi:hypothetical protein
MKALYFLVWFILSLTRSQNAFAQPPDSDTTIYGRNDKASHYIKTRGINMYYETYGQGQPLLIIHGNGGSIKDFRYQIPYFAENYRVIVADIILGCFLKS